MEKLGLGNSTENKDCSDLGGTVGFDNLTFRLLNWDSWTVSYTCMCVCAFGIACRIELHHVCTTCVTTNPYVQRCVHTYIHMHIHINDFS